MPRRLNKSRPKKTSGDSTESLSNLNHRFSKDCLTPFWSPDDARWHAHRRKAEDRRETPVVARVCQIRRRWVGQSVRANHECENSLPPGGVCVSMEPYTPARHIRS